MSLGGRLLYAGLGALFGAMIAVLCWWFFGMHHTWTHVGDIVGRNIKHWLLVIGGGYAFAGFVWGEQVADAVGWGLSAILWVETTQVPSGRLGSFVLLLFLLAIVAVAWGTAPI